MKKLVCLESGYNQILTKNIILFSEKIIGLKNHTWKNLFFGNPHFLWFSEKILKKKKLNPHFLWI